MGNEEEIRKWMEEISSQKESKKKLVFDKSTKRLLVVSENDPRVGDNIVFSPDEATRFGAERVEPPDDMKDPASLRKWWHKVLSKPGRYYCYAIFLVLPSDKDALKYVTDFGNELDLLSNENCLILALSEAKFMISKFNKAEWIEAINEQTEKGHSLRIAKLFDVNFSQFPCVLFFQDIRLADHAIVYLKGMTTEEIATNMRSVFSVIDEAVSQNKNPINAIWSYRNNEAFMKKGKTFIGDLRAFAGKTFETAVNVWLEAVIKK